jgi:hypothetical protein
MTFKEIEYLKKHDKRSQLRYIGLGLALVCGIAGAVLWLSDRTTPHLLTLAALWAGGVWAQHTTYKFADAHYSGF